MKPTSKRPKVKALSIVGTKAHNPDARREALSVEWRTPEYFLELERLYVRGPVVLDAATTRDNPTRADRFLTAGKRCGLKTSWSAELDQLPGRPRVVWINPPYGEFASAFYDKIVAEVAGDPTIEVHALLPYNRAETLYMQRLLAVARLECVVRGRMAFVGPSGEPGECNTFASVLYALGNVDEVRFAQVFGKLGLVRATRVVGRP